MQRNFIKKYILLRTKALLQEHSNFNYFIMFLIEHNFHMNNV